MKRGWWKFWRKMEDWEWWEDDGCLRAWCTLLDHVAIKEEKYQGRDLKPGQMITSQRYFGYLMRPKKPLTEQQVKTIWKKLKLANCITVQSTNKFSLITVNNWELYQGEQLTKQLTKERSNNQQSTDKSTDKATVNQPTIKKRSKEDKKERSKEDVAVSVMNLFNQTCPSLPKLVDVSSDVRQQRILELNSFLLEHQMTWNRFFEIVEASDYLTGRSGKWKRCNFDWIIKRDNYIKIVEGRFDENWTDSEYTQENRKQKARSHVYTNEGSSYDLSGRLPCDAWAEDY